LTDKRAFFTAVNYHYESISDFHLFAIIFKQ